ncbi:hypothetical protein MMC28_010684 [Mycoblastus sanguinarius]|nr:hypothetical protein [Mycoblastus sanguinarius]
MSLTSSSGENTLLPSNETSHDPHSISPDQVPQSSKPILQKAQYCAPSASDLRSPCPIINALANHGYIPRDGRNVTSHEVYAAMAEVGVSSTIRTTLTYAAYLEHHDVPQTGFWAFVRSPFAYFLQHFALRAPHQENSSGVPCLNLDQLSRHGAVEHDVSLSRRDFAQGDNTTPQRDLIAGLVSSSSDGKEITMDDFATFRRRRVEEQKRDNPQLVFGSVQNTMACAEAAFILTLFGVEARANAVPVSHVKALFGEERLPVEEGWRKRKWWPLGFVELNLQARKLSKRIDLQGII